MTIAVPRGEIIEKKAGQLNKNDNLGHHLVSRGAEKICYKTQNVQKKKNKFPPALEWRPLHSFFPSQSLRQNHMVTSQSTLTTGGR